jgi:hypothetical protein
MVSVGLLSFNYTIFSQQQSIIGNNNIQIFGDHNIIIPGERNKPSIPEQLDKDNLLFDLPVNCEGSVLWATCRLKITNSYQNRQGFMVGDAYLIDSDNRYIAFKVAIDDPLKFDVREMYINSRSSFDVKLTFKSIGRQVSLMEINIFNLTTGKKITHQFAVNWIHR